MRLAKKKFATSWAATRQGLFIACIGIASASRQTRLNGHSIFDRDGTLYLDGKLSFCRINRMGKAGSATGNRTRVLRLRISRPNP